MKRCGRYISFYTWGVAWLFSCNGINFRGRGRFFIRESSEFPVCRVSLSSANPSSCSLISWCGLLCFFLFLCLRPSWKLSPGSVLVLRPWWTGIGVGTRSLSSSSNWPQVTAGVKVVVLTLLCLTLFFLLLFKSRLSLFSTCSCWSLCRWTPPILGSFRFSLLESPWATVIDTSPWAVLSTGTRSSLWLPSEDFEIFSRSFFVTCFLLSVAIAFRLFSLSGNTNIKMIMQIQWMK